MTRIGLLRHARTRWNAEGRIQGRADSPLTAEGLAAARLWTPALAPYGFRALRASPQGRAMATALALGEGLGLTPVPAPGLEEQDFGQWTGRTVAELRAGGLLAPQEALGWAFTPPGGESRADVLARAWAALTGLGRAHPEGVLVVTHEGVIRAVLYALLGRDYLPAEPKALAPRALHLLSARGDCLRLEDRNIAL